MHGSDVCASFNSKNSNGRREIDCVCERDPTCMFSPSVTHNKEFRFHHCDNLSIVQNEDASKNDESNLSPKVVGMGSSGVDYLAQVASYPRPDEKLRTEKLEVHGGGNCGNALTAAARLGLKSYIIAKIGDDALGDGIISEFSRDGVETDGILRAAGSPSPFTYIIVDREGGTRTCIHTPGQPLDPSELNPEIIERALHDACLVYFDGRLAEAAVVVAQEARARGIPILVEGERLRDGLDDLLELADYVITSEAFPMQWTGENSTGTAVMSMLERLPRVQWIVTTMGKTGSVLLERMKEFQDLKAPQGSDAAHSKSVDEIICDGRTKLNERNEMGAAHTPITQPFGGKDRGIAVGRSWTAPETVAVGSLAEDARTPSNIVRVTVATAADIPRDDVIDTTGAGDAFIGSMVFCIARGIPPSRAIGFCSVVAAMNCTALGARGGMPRLEDIEPKLLEATGLQVAQKRTTMAL